MKVLLDTYDEPHGSKRSIYARKQYPTRSFSEALEVLAVVSSMSPRERKSKDYRKILAKQLHRSDNQTLRFMIANAKQYNLICGRGRIRASPAGKKLLSILAEYKENPLKFVELEKDIFLKVPLFQDMYGLYQEKGLKGLPTNGDFTKKILSDFGEQYNIRKGDAKNIASEYMKFVRHFESKPSEFATKLILPVLPKSELDHTALKKLLIFEHPELFRGEIMGMTQSEIENALKTCVDYAETEREEIMSKIALGIMQNIKLIHR